MNGEVVRILALLIISACIAIMLREHRAEYALPFTLAAAATVLAYILRAVVPAISGFKALIEQNGIPAGALAVPLKALGIAYLTGFTADTCRDFGQSALAAKAELAGRCAIFVLTLPMLESVLEAALGFAEK